MLSNATSSLLSVCRCRPEDIEAEIAAFLLQERNEFNHFRFVFETRGEQKPVVPVVVVSVLPAVDY